MFYISTVRSLIDYAAPVLVCCSPSQLKPLELIQNEAMRTILGCPRTAKLEVLRAELELPSVVCRVYEITCRTISRMICHGDTELKQALTTLQATPNIPAKSYLKLLHKLLSAFNVLEPCLSLINSPYYPTWKPHRVSVDVEKLGSLITVPPLFTL